MIYLDCAATSMHKPRTVQKAINRAMATMASPGRGCHRPAMLAADCVLDTRILLADYFNVGEPENVIFTSSATHALNIAINSLVNSGDNVVISGYEHNSVTRPLRGLNASLSVASSPLFSPLEAVSAFEQQLDKADCAVCTYVSNVFGYILPIKEISALCKKRGVPLIIDASQAAGVLSIDLLGLDAAFVAMPGHKGLLGPQGTGVLLCNSETRPVLFGGTGSNSASDSMPDFLPERLEAGTHNVSGIAGLYEGVKFIISRSEKTLLDHERKLRELFTQLVSPIPELEIFISDDPEMQTGVLSLRSDRLSSDELAERLGSAGICIRSGLHCSPSAHETAGTLESGTARFSFSPFNTAAEVRCAANAMIKIFNNM
ncbi:MAG: aminotransferase class V-fold PLP-dependent enzyme [Clostridiales bacterium]|nr:aminotransferase class V-fold PLP-dependent enzyme [Clostridiales bacterium]